MDFETFLDSLDRERRTYHLEIPSMGGDVIDARLYLPKEEGRYPGVLFGQGLITGNLLVAANALGRYVTRIGAAVLIPTYVGHREDRLCPDDAEHVVNAFQTLKGIDEVIPEHVGMLGFSYGGQIALTGAADPRIAADVRYVVSVGGPTDMESMMLFGLTDPGASKSARRIVHESLVESLRTEIRRREQLGTMEDALYRDFFLVDEMLETKSAYHVARMMGMLSSSMWEEMKKLSPLKRAESIEARVMLVHGKDDAIVPFEQSMWMHEALLAAGKETELIAAEGIGHIVYPTKPREAMDFVRNRLSGTFERIIEFMRR